MDDSWFGKMLNCPNCRGIIDVPSKHTHDAMGAAMVPQRDRPRKKRAIYYALTAILLVLILIPFFWHGPFQADSDDHSQGAADYLQDRSSELAERREVPLAQGRASNAIYFYLQDIVRDYRDRFGDVPMRNFRTTVDEMLREKAEPDVVKIVDEVVMPRLAEMGLARDYDPKELRVHYRNSSEAPYPYLENLDPQTIDRLSVTAVDIAGVQFPVRSAQNEEKPVPEVASASTESATTQASAPSEKQKPNIFNRVFRANSGKEASEETAPDPVEKLLASPELWPSEVTLAQDTEFPAVLNGKVVGKVKVNAGAKVGLTAVEADVVEVEFRGAKIKLPYDATDIAQLATDPVATDASKVSVSKKPKPIAARQVQNKDLSASPQIVETLLSPERSKSGMPGNGKESIEVSLNQPKGVAFDSKNNLYVADSGNHRILAFSPDLKLLRSLGKEGSGKGRFNRPFDVAIDSKGRWVVADTGNHRIQIFDAKGGFVKAFGSNGTEDGQFDNPSNVTIDERDNIIVTDRGNNRLQVFDREGKRLFTFANRTGEKTVERIEAENIWELQQDPKKSPADIKVDPSWKISDYGQLHEPGGTWYDKTNKELWVANGWNCRYERFDYDSRSGEIRRKSDELIDGIVRGPWYTRGCTGTIDGGLIGLQTHFGALQVFSDRSELTFSTPVGREVSGAPLGGMGGIHDIASNANGEVAVADPGNNRIVFFDKDLTVPLNPSVPFLTRDGGKITWSTSTASPTEIMLRRGDFPEHTKGREAPWTDGQEEIKVVRFSPRLVHNHEAVLTGLKPGTRYYYKVRQPDLKAIPSEGWSREYAFATHAAEGEVEFLRFPLKTLLLPNLIDVETIRPDTPFPESMSESDIERYYKDQWKQVELFYWVNSGMKYLIDHDVYVDRTMFRTGDIEKGQFKSEAEKARYEALPIMNHGTGESRVAQNQLLEKMISADSDNDEIYFGQMFVECIRDWQERQKAWKYRGSGGGAFGLEEWPAPGRTFFLGGSDVAWLMCHEYKHQVESNYNISGLDKPQDRMWFCHFSQPFPGWDLSSADDHGDHWDGIAWQLRHHKRDSYLRSLFGIVEVTADKDGDGIPDDDPRVPLDEKRLGSSPASQDTDGDGLADMEEVMASTWVRALITDVRERVEVDYIRPDLTNADSDGDGVPDGLDVHPIYPYSAAITKGTATIDGKLDEWTAEPQIKFNAEGITIEVWSRWNNSGSDTSQESNETDALFYAVRMNGNWSSLNVVFDFDADGFYVGNDNLHMNIVADKKEGPALRNARLHLCKLGRWPWFDDKHQYFRPDEIRFASSANGDTQVLEFAIPRRDILGLHLKRGEEIGLTLEVGLPNGGSVSVFEPYDIFDSTLVD